MTSHQTSKKEDAFDYRFATWLYRLRWPLTLTFVVLVAVVFTKGTGYVGRLTESVNKIGDVTNGSGQLPPQMFDSDMRVWFGPNDEAVKTYDEIEDRFVAEDYLMVSFEENDSEFGVFSRESLGTIKRLTEKFLTIPGVRHVRSLTYNPWIRWGTIRDAGGDEEGLLISDLITVDPAALSDQDIITRMVAVLGAERAAEKIGEERVRQVIGQEAKFSDHLGEPLLLGTIINESSDVSVIQIQVLRPHVSEEKRETLFADENIRKAVPNIYSIHYQRAALRGIEHYLSEEQGLLEFTDDYHRIEAWVAALPEGEDKESWQVQLNDPTKIFMTDADGKVIRKYFEYQRQADGSLADMSDPMAPVPAMAGYQPKPLSDYTFRLGGVPAFERNFEVTGMADGLYVPLMFLVLMVVLYIMFRSWIGVFVPILVVFSSVMAMIGTSFANADLLNNLTMISPNMLTAVAIADAIHLMTSWFMLRANYDDRRTLLVEVIRKNALPVFLTSVTTAIGFYSLMLSEIQPVKMLGMTAGLGTLAAYFLSMTFVPAILSLMPSKKTTAQATAISSFFNTDRAARLASMVVSYRRPIAMFAFVLIVVSFFGLKSIHLDTDFRSMFPESNKTISDFNWIERKLGGVGDLEIVFDAVSGPETIKNLSAADEERLNDLLLRQALHQQGEEGYPALNIKEQKVLETLSKEDTRWQASRIGVDAKFLSDLNAFEGRLREEMAQADSPLRIVTDLVSPLDILRKMHQVQNKNNTTFYRVPQSKDVPADLQQATLKLDDFTEEWELTPGQNVSNMVAQYYLQYENGARPGENLSTQLSTDRQHFRMQGRIEQAASLVQLVAFDRIREIAQTEFPRLGDKMKISGKTLLFARTSHLFDVGFTKSLSFALVMITLIIGLIFRSLRLALVSLVPNVLPILLPLSFFGLLGIPLDGPAILISSIALGVCVDDTIHFLTKYVEATRQGQSSEQAIAHVIQQTGAAITITTIVLVIGFMTMLLSSFAPNFMMGVLATIMIALAWLADFVITPAMLALTARETKMADSEYPLNEPVTT